MSRGSVGGLVEAILKRNGYSRDNQRYAPHPSEPSNNPQKGIIFPSTIDVRRHPEEYERDRKKEQKGRRGVWWDRGSQTITGISAFAALIVSGLAFHQTQRQADAACKAYEPLIYEAKFELVTDRKQTELVGWFHNIGGSTAISHRSSLNISKTRLSPSRSDASFVVNDSKKVGFVSGREPSQIVIQVDKSYAIEAFLDAIHTGERTIWIYGFIEYFDSWQRPYRFNFCEVSMPDNLSGQKLPVQDCGPEYKEYKNPDVTQRKPDAPASPAGSC